MSIVERAIAKVRDSTKSDSEVTPVARPVESVRAPDRARPVARDQVAAAAPEQGNALDHAQLASVRLDVARMQAGGLLPRQEFANKVVDEFRRLKWPLLAAILGRSGDRVALSNRLMVTSAVPGEGKTFTSTNLALSFAREKHTPVLLVDADVARATLSHKLGLAERPGVTELLESPDVALESVVLRTEFDQVYVLPAGRSTPFAPELMASPRMSVVAQQVSALVGDGVVVFDSPPLLATNEAQVLIQHMGYCLFVVRADVTPQAAVREAIELCPRDVPLACVLNGASAAAVGYYGRYGYGYGYADNRSGAGARTE